MLFYYENAGAQAARLNELQQNTLNLILKSSEGILGIANVIAGFGEDLEGPAIEDDDFWPSFTEAALAHQEAIKKAEEDRALALARQTADFERDVANAYADLRVELARMDRDYYEDRAEIMQEAAEEEEEQQKERIDRLAEHNKEMARLAEDHARRMEEIQREMNLGVEAAVEDRDVSAAIEAIRRGKEEMRAEEERYQVDKKRREEDFKERLDEMGEMRDEKRKSYEQELADLKRNHERKRQERLYDFNIEMQRKRQEFAIRQQREAEDFRAQMMRLMQQFRSEWDMTESHYNILNSIVAYGMTRIEDTVRTNWDNIVSQMTAYAAPAPAPQSPQIYPAPYSPAQESYFDSLFGFRGFADGGDFAPGEVMRVGERGPEWVRFGTGGHVYPNGQSPFSMTNNISGYNPVDSRQIEEVFRYRILPKFMNVIRRYK